jgi:hypothetical protein
VIRPQANLAFRVLDGAAQCRDLVRGAAERAVDERAKVRRLEVLGPHGLGARECSSASSSRPCMKQLRAQK